MRAGYNGGMPRAQFRGVPLRRPTPTPLGSAFNPDIFKMIQELYALHALHDKFTTGIDLVNRALATFESVKQGRPGLPGKNATDAQVRAAVRTLYVQPKDGEAPSAEEVAAHLLKSKQLRKMIELSMKPGKDGTLPPSEELAAQVFAEMEKMGISLENLKNIETRMAEIRNHVATKDTWRGGGDTIAAGAGIGITVANGVKTISSVQGTSSITGAVNGTNRIFIAATTPTIVFTEGGHFVNGFGVTITGLTIVFDAGLAPQQWIKYV